jgi:hypothetical protein
MKPLKFLALVTYLWFIASDANSQLKSTRSKDPFPPPRPLEDIEQELPA